MKLFRWNLKITKLSKIALQSTNSFYPQFINVFWSVNLELQIENQTTTLWLTNRFA